MKLRQQIFFYCCIAIIAFSCNENNITIDNHIKKIFTTNHIEGTFAIYDNTRGRFMIYPLPSYKDSTYSPLQTFDIITSLIAIQNNAVNTHTVYPIAPNNITLKEAFQQDTSHLSTYLSTIIDTLQIKQWIDSLHYGNQSMLSINVPYWMSSLTISPDEQMGLIKKLYFNLLPFYKTTQTEVLNLFTKESNTLYTLGYKIATTPHASWIIGWIEENRHPYFFVVYARPLEHHIIQPLLLLKSILMQEGFMQGEK